MSIPTAPVTPTLLQKISKYSAPTVKLMAVVAIALAAVTGDPAEWADPLQPVPPC